MPNNVQAIRDALESNELRFMTGGVVSGSRLVPKSPALKPGALVRWVSATDLAQWGERRDGQRGMPELLRRLIFATLGPAAAVALPCDDSVQHSGWDGLCETEEGTAYVPSGTSGWEIGAQRRGIRGKAEDDYEKRSRDPLGLDRRTATFVFVTSQRFTGKAAWRAEKLSAGTWRDVGVIDADDLVHWLELCPAVAQWLALLMGRRPHGLRNLGEAWEEWRRATKTPLSAEVMVTDRDEEASAVLKWLLGPPAHLAVQAGSTEEATAFLRAALDDLPEDHLLTYESRCLVAADADTARDLVGIGTPLVIVPPDGEPGLVQLLVADGHHVYAAHGQAALHVGNARALPRPWRHNLQVALARMSVPEENARQLSKGSGRSLTVLRRLMPAAPAFRPRLAAEPSPELIAAMLAGSWNQTSAADRKVVAALVAVHTKRSRRV